MTMGIQNPVAMEKSEPSSKPYNPTMEEADTERPLGLLVSQCSQISESQSQWEALPQTNKVTD